MTFEDLFVGSDLSHGSYDPRRRSPARTVDGPATGEDYAQHLAGDVGLGLVPVRPDGTCRFGAIDIDVDTIDHATLYLQVTTKGLPLSVCRSKSGGAHLYVFAAEPGLPAAKLKLQLERWAQELGYGGVEVFPKQTKTGSNNLGNWLNLPYFDAAQTARYCQGPSGPLSFEEFLASVVPWTLPVGPALVKQTGELETVEATEDSIFKILGQGPPCLEQGVKLGVPAGARNSFMFNLAIGARRAAPNTWKEVVKELNERRCNPPLDRVELDTVLKSVARKPSYEFQCTEGAIAGLCNFQGCLKRPYGKGYKREQDAENFDQLQLTHLRKINTDPPRYVLEVNGTDLELNSEQMLTYAKLRRRLVERLDLVPPNMRQDRWELQLQELLKQREDIDAPEDASQAGLLMDRVRDYLLRYKRARSLEDLLKDLPYKHDERVLFRASGLFHFLSQYRLDQDSPTVFAQLHALGGQHVRQRIKGRVTAVWSIPYSELREQLEEFNPIEVSPGDELL